MAMAAWDCGAWSWSAADLGFEKLLTSYRIDHLGLFGQLRAYVVFFAFLFSS
jgi:hypothetical protein